MKPIGTVLAKPSFGKRVVTLALAVLLSVVIDSVLIVVGFAIASNFVDGLSEDAGVFGVIIMVVSLVIIWPVVLIPLIVVLVTDGIIRRMPMWLFVVCFSAPVTAAFAIFIFIAVWNGRSDPASFLLNVTVLVDVGIAGLVAATFAIVYKTLSARALRSRYSLASNPPTGSRG